LFRINKIIEITTQSCKSCIKIHWQEGKSVHKHNQFSESVFGYLDQLLRVKPNISTLSAEAYALFSNNQTAAWLNSKSSEDREKIVKQARIEAVKATAKFRDRLKMI